MRSIKLAPNFKGSFFGYIASWSIPENYLSSSSSLSHTQLPVRQLVTFKIAVLVFQYLTGRAPAYRYLADDCQLTSDVSTRRLRSTDIATCVVRRSNNSFSERCFAAAGPRLWNMLPIHLRLCDSLGQYKRLLKTHLFGVWDRGAL